MITKPTMARLTRKRLLLLVPVALVVLGAGLYEWQTRLMWGWLAGEAFYQGRPTSYWRVKLARWEFTPTREMPIMLVYQDSWVEEHLRVMGVNVLGVEGLPFEDADPTSVPVLIDLLKDRDVRVRRCAALRAFPVAMSKPLRAALKDRFSDEDALVRRLAQAAFFQVWVDAIHEDGIR